MSRRELWEGRSNEQPRIRFILYFVTTTINNNVVVIVAFFVIKKSHIIDVDIYGDI